MVKRTWTSFQWWNINGLKSWAIRAFLIPQLVKNPPAMQETLGIPFNSWVGKICWRRNRLPTPVFLGVPCGSAGKESNCNAGDLGSIPGLGRSHGEGKGYPLQYSGLEKSIDREAWQAIYSPWGRRESDTTERLSLSLWCWVQEACTGPCFCSPSPDFSPGSLKVAVGFLVAWYLVGHNLLQLCMHTVIFSPSSFLCVLLLERVVQVQTLQQRVPGPSLIQEH